MENNTQKHSAKKTLLLIAVLVVAAAAMFCIYKVFIPKGQTGAKEITNAAISKSVFLAECF